MARREHGDGGHEEQQGGGGERKAVEYWAEEAGMWPQWQEATVTVAGGRLMQERRENPRFIEFAQAKALRGWPIGAEVTRAEFEAAIEEAKGGVIR